MPEKPSVKSSELSLASVPAFWPMAMAAALLEEGAELYADNLKFVEEEIKITASCAPSLRRPTLCGSICEPWCCGITASPAESPLSSMRLTPDTRQRSPITTRARA